MAELGQYVGMLLGRGESKSSSRRFRYKGPADQRDAFTQYYNENLRHLVDRFEDQRQQCLQQYRSRSRITAISIFCFAIGMYVLWSRAQLVQVFEVLVFIAFALSAFMFNWSQKPVREYHSSIKGIIFPRVIEYFGSSFKYQERPDWHVTSLKPFDVLPRYDKFECEDQVTGDYKDVPFKMMELRLIRESSDSKRSDTTVFNGLVIQLQANKPFSGKTLVVRDGGILGALFKSSRKGLERVQLEDPEFEKHFDVYSSDQIEARYLLTPAFMERLRKLRMVFFGKSMCCSFFQDKLFLAIETTRDLFAPSSIYQPVTFTDDIASVMNGLAQITKVVDRLQMDQKTHL